MRGNMMRSTYTYLVVGEVPHSRLAHRRVAALRVELTYGEGPISMRARALKKAMDEFGNDFQPTALLWMEPWETDEHYGWLVNEVEPVPPARFEVDTSEKPGG